MSAASGARLILLGAIWGSSFLFMRVAVPSFGPASLIAARLALAAAVLTLVALASRRPMVPGAHWRHFLIVGAVNSATPFLLFAYAAKTLPASILAVLNSLAPLFGALIGALVFGVRVTARVTFGLLAGIAGVSVLSWGQVQEALLIGQGGATILALGASIAAALCYAVATSYVKWSSVKVDAFANAQGSMWAATVLAAPLAATQLPVGVPGVSAWAAVLMLGIVCTAMAYLLQFRLIADIGPTRALTVTFLIPLFGVLWGVLFLSEPIGWNLVVGGLMVVLGTVFVTIQAAPAAGKGT